MGGKPDIIALLRWYKIWNIALVQSLQRSFRSLVLPNLVEQRDKLFILLPVHLFKFDGEITHLLQSVAAEEERSIIMLPQQMLFLWRNHGCQLLQIAYHQELHTTERQIVALAILAKHRIYSIEQIAAHHTDFVDNEQVDTADDIALELAELIAFLFAAAKGRARHVWREGKLEERMDGHSSGVDGCNARRSKHNHSFGRQFFQSLEEGRLTCARLSGKEEVGICLFYDIPCQDGFFVHFHTASLYTSFYTRTRFLLIFRSRFLP